MGCARAPPVVHPLSPESSTTCRLLARPPGAAYHMTRCRCLLGRGRTGARLFEKRRSTCRTASNAPIRKEPSRKARVRSEWFPDIPHRGFRNCGGTRCSRHIRVAEPAIQSHRNTAESNGHRQERDESIPGGMDGYESASCGGVRAAQSGFERSPNRVVRFRMNGSSNGEAAD